MTICQVGTIDGDLDVGMLPEYLPVEQEDGAVVGHFAFGCVELALAFLPGEGPGSAEGRGMMAEGGGGMGETPYVVLKTGDEFV